MLNEGPWRQNGGVTQLGGMLVFVAVSVIIIALFTGYLVWDGKWVARRWWKRAERDNAPKRSGRESFQVLSVYGHAPEPPEGPRVRMKRSQ